MKFLTNLLKPRPQPKQNPEMSNQLREAIRISTGQPDRERQAARKQFANQRRVAATNRTNIDQNNNHQKENTIMTEAETETVESTGKKPPKPEPK